MLSKITKRSKLSFIILMLIALIMTISGLAKSYTSSVPVSITVPTASLEISGYAAPGALVTIYDGTNPMASVSTDSSGNFIKLISSIQSGLHSISVSQQDIKGVESSTVNRIISIPPQQLTQIEFSLPPTITANTNELNEGESISISGYTYPGQNVELILDNLIGPYKKVKSDANGYFSYSFNTTDFYEGKHTLKVRADSPIGFTIFSKNIGFNIIKTQQTEPSPKPGDNSIIPAASGGGNIKTPEISDPPSQANINGDKATIKGNSIPNAQIIITINGEVVGSVFANSSGEWVFDYYPKEAKNIVTVVACIDKKCSDKSEPITFYFKVLGSVACRDSIILNKYRFNIGQNEKVHLEAIFDNQRARVIELDWGDGVIEKFSVTADTKEQSYQHTYALVGQYNATITTTYQDEVCVATKYFTVKVDENTDSKISIALLLIVILGLIVTVAIRIRNKLKLKKTDNSTTR